MSMELQTEYLCIKKRWGQFYIPHYITLLIAIPITLEILRTDPMNWVLQLAANGTLTQTLIPDISYYFSFNGVNGFGLPHILAFILVFVISVIGSWFIHWITIKIRSKRYKTGENKAV